MKIKRYVALNMRTALTEIANELGKDAVILSSKQLKDGVEVMAAVDFDESIFNQDNIKKVKTSDLTNKIVDDNVTTDKKVQWVNDPAIETMQDRIRNLEGLLKEHLSYQKWKDIEIDMPNKAEVIKRLVAKDFDPIFIKQLLKAMPDFEYFELAWQEAQKILASELLIESDLIIEKPGIFALLGTTGVGKTTTIAKLAARFALKNRQDNIGLITTDIYRIAAREQLAVYANILNIPIYVTETEKQFKQAMHRLRGKKLILIDTAGFSQKDPKFIEQIDFIKNCSEQIQFIAVLSAVTGLPIQNEVVELFKSESIRRAIITKLDEANSLGGILSILMRETFNLSYVCNGQRVPEDIMQANAIELIRSACAYKNVLTSETSLAKVTESIDIDIGEKHVKTVY